MTVSVETYATIYGDIMHEMTCPCGWWARSADADHAIDLLSAHEVTHLAAEMAAQL